MMNFTNAGLPKSILSTKKLLVFGLLLSFAIGCSPVQSTDDTALAEQPAEQPAEEPRETVEESSNEADLYGEIYDVVVANIDIPAGTPLEMSAISTREIPWQFLPANPLLRQDVEIYLGQPISTNISSGAMILTGDFRVAEVARTLSARIPAGERAFTLSSDELSGINDLLTPGDRVDILGTFSINESNELDLPSEDFRSGDLVTISLLQNVTLLAIDGCISDFQECDPSNGERISLSVTPAEAELLIVSQAAGELTLLLRNREDLETTSSTLRTIGDVLKTANELTEIREDRTFPRPSPCPPRQTRTATGECVPDSPQIISQ